MSATQAVKECLATMKPEPGVSVERFAQQMYDMQWEIYSAHAGRDLQEEIDLWRNLDKETKDEWIAAAKRKMP
jgi:hypothetical protein